MIKYFENVNNIPLGHQLRRRIYNREDEFLHEIYEIVSS